MKTICADYNAMTEAEHLRLNFRDSQEDIKRAGLHPGDWAWFSDGEILVGGQLRSDPHWGLLGVPAWETLVHLDDEDTHDFRKHWSELQALLLQTARSAEDEARIFQLLTVFEQVAPPEIRAVTPPGYLALRRAGALHSLGQHELALLEVEEARQARPDDPDAGFFYFELLLRVAPERAAREAEDQAEAADVPAPVLAACINIWSTAAEQVPDGKFEPIGLRILEWADRFESAPGRDQVRASVLAQVQFNRGLILLRLGRTGEAHRALERAHAMNPEVDEIDEAQHLDAFDDRARGIAARLRARPLPIPVAA
jgi:tetratricopeptide (TPR) repeat protein